MKGYATLLILSIAAFSSAQSYDSFTAATSITGVTVTNTANAYTVSIAPGASITTGGSTYSIVNDFGFYVLQGGGNLTSSFSATDQNGWGYGEKSNVNGSMAGWDQPNKKNPITPGGTPLTFTFSQAKTSLISSYGFHFTLALPSGGQTTGFYRTNVQATPEPITMGLGVASLGVAIRQRRARRKANA